MLRYPEPSFPSSWVDWPPIFVISRPAAYVIMNHPVEDLLPGEEGRRVVEFWYSVSRR
jgi:hypothetical protein